MKRRDFLKTFVGASAGAIIAGTLPRGEGLPVPHASPLPPEDPIDDKLIDDDISGSSTASATASPSEPEYEPCHDDRTPYGGSTLTGTNPRIFICLPDGTRAEIPRVYSAHIDVQRDFIGDGIYAGQTITLSVNGMYMADRVIDNLRGCQCNIEVEFGNERTVGLENAVMTSYTCNADGPFSLEWIAYKYYEAG